MSDLNTRELDLDRLQRNSKRSAALTSLGTLIVFGVFGYSVWEVNRLNTAIATKKEELRSLDDTKASLEKEKDKLQNDIRRLERYSEILFRQYRDTADFSAQLEQRTNSRPGELLAQAPIQAVVVPRASAEKISDEPQLYDFSLWLEVPLERRPDIEKVTYFFDHPSFREKVFESSDPRDDFRVHYRGWGALRRVIISVHLKNGNVSQLAFDMADAINKADLIVSRDKVPIKGIRTKDTQPVPVK